jgi:membrane protease YdiL (CAAX protease family)
MTRRFLLTVLFIWVAGFPAGLFYADQQHISIAAALPALLAVLAELTAYASLSCERARAAWRPAWLVLAAPLPYALYALPAGVFEWSSAAALAALAALAAGWFGILGSSPAARFGFVLLMAAPVLFRFFPPLLARPHPELRLEFLGQLMWIRVGILTVLRELGPDGIGFGFLPRPRDWRIGIVWYLASLPALLLLAPLTGFARFTPPPDPWWQTAAAAAATFLGILWVVALGEEFFFRGLLQRWLTEAFRSPWAGLAAASLLFAAAHLGFRKFPNWDFALLALAAGAAYGMAYRQSGAIRAPMVAHALLVTTWRILYR